MMKEAVKKVLNKLSSPLFILAVIGMSMLGLPSSASARSSWYVSLSTGPVWVAPAPVCYPAPVVRCRPVVYYDYPAPVVYYPAPVISVGYYSGWHHHYHR